MIFFFWRKPLTAKSENSTSGSKKKKFWNLQGFPPSQKSGKRWNFLNELRVHYLLSDRGPQRIYNIVYDHQKTYSYHTALPVCW